MGRRVGLRAELRPFGGAGGAQKGGDTWGGGELRSPSAPPLCKQQCMHTCVAELQPGTSQRIGSSAASKGTEGLRALSALHGGRQRRLHSLQPPPTPAGARGGGALSCTGPPGCTPVGAARAEPRTLHAASCTRSSASPPVRAPPRPRRALVARRRAPRAPRRAERCTSLHGALCRCTSLHAAVPPHPTGAALAAALRPRDGWELSAAPCLLLTFGNATAPRAAPRRGEPHPRGLWLSTSN